MRQQLSLAGPADTDALGRNLAQALLAVRPASLCIYLHGELGAGKTALARSLLQGCGHAGRVPSPTYTLVEPYECAGLRFFHMDLYRLADPGELEYLGIDELAGPGSVLLVEWPEHGRGELVPADLEVFLKVKTDGRDCILQASTPVGEDLLVALSEVNS
jgi:tRNA threonylcarbamoyladenosine biosynthesis protein TsaE